MKITDKKIAEFVGTTDRTLLNWKKPRVLENGTKFLSAVGKHNLYKGAKIAAYLLAYQKDNDEIMFNNLEVLKSNSDELFELIQIACKDNKYEQQIEDMVSSIKKIVNDIDNLFDF